MTLRTSTDWLSKITATPSKLPYPFSVAKVETKLWAEVALNNKLPDWSLSFDENISRIDSLFWAINPIAFSVNSYISKWILKWLLDPEKIVKNEKWSSLWTLKILLYWVINDLTVWEILLLFSEHYTNVIDNPNDVDNHKNIRAIMTFPKDMKVRHVCPELQYSNDEKLKEIVLNYKPQN